MSNWLKRAFARVTGRTPKAQEADGKLSQTLNAAADTNRKTSASGGRAPARKKRASGPGYGSSTRRSTSDDTTIYSPVWYSGGDSGGYSGGYDSGGSCGGDGGGGGCD